MFLQTGFFPIIAHHPKKQKPPVQKKQGAEMPPRRPRSDQMVPVTVITLIPGVTVNSPVASLRVNAAAGTVIS